MVPRAARNCFPSLHFAWTLLTFWYSRGMHPAARGLLLALAGLTALSTLGLGEHYAIDLVAAVPFALWIEALFAAGLPLRAPRRRLALLVPPALLLAWAAIALAPADAIVPGALLWPLAAATVAIPLFLEHRLARGAAAAAGAAPEPT